MGQGNKCILTKLLKRSRKCFYCYRKVYENRPNRDICNPNSATVDHVYSKTDLRRNLVSKNKNVVLCCYSCNQNKSKLENIEDAKYRIIHRNCNISIIGALVHGDIGQTF